VSSGACPHLAGWFGIAEQAIEVQRRTGRVRLPLHRRQLKIGWRLERAIVAVQREFRLWRKRGERKIVLTVPAAVGGFKPEVTALGTLHSRGGETGAAMGDADDASAPATASSSRWMSARRCSASGRTPSPTGTRPRARSASRSLPLAKS